MEGIIQTHEVLEKKGNLARTIEDTQKLIDQLQAARDAISTTPESAALTMAKLRQPIKSTFDKLDDDLKEVNKGLNQYQKALDKKFKKAALPSAGNDAMASQPALINRAIAMHLLREGKFGVASTFVKEVNARPTLRRETGLLPVSNDRDWASELVADPDALGSSHGAELDAEMSDDGEITDSESGYLQKKFAEMYHILDALRNQHNLGPAIEWSRQHSMELEQRGSNLEFELARLKFVELYNTDNAMSEDPDPYSGALRALEYARTTFPSFSTRYTKDTSSLLGSLAYAPDLSTSPYTNFYNQTSWTSVAESFTAEFCGMLGLSSHSPLYTAVTAGAIALPVLEKVERVMAATRGQWTSVNELPVETPLPREFVFHSIFVCPVSKEQGTDVNPPVMLPCGHVIAKESLEGHARGKSRVKCPYCPMECAVRDGRRVYI